MASHGVSRPASSQPRTARQREEELNTIARYKALVELVELKVAERQYTAEVLQLTSKLLTENPEYYTIWNVRRRLLTCGLFSKSSDLSLLSNLSSNSSPMGTSTTLSESSFSSASTLTEDATATRQSLNPQSHGKNGTTLELIKDDLGFLVPLLRQYPKCYWIWKYRLWLLQEANVRLGADVARRLWQEDLGLVGVMLVKDSRNFHGWNYRRIVVAQLESPTLGGASMAEAEFAYTTKMISVSLSNFSAWHYRSKLIPRLLDERKADDSARRKFLDDEFETMRNALWTDSKDQSLWFYYQFLMTTITDQKAQTSITPNLSQTERIGYLKRQVDELREMLDGAEDRKWICNALFEYSIALYRMEERQPKAEERRELRELLTELRSLDPLRHGRWTDLANSLSLQG